MAGSKSHLIQNAREIWVSTDATRMGKLAAREQQDADRAKATRADFYMPGMFNDFSVTRRVNAFEAIPGLLRAPSLEGQGGTFDMLLGEGEAERDTSDTGDPDVSIHQVARWADQPITWPLACYPDGSLFKICTICVEPTDVSTDAVSRNILLNPATRTFTPTTVNKTSNPSAVILVVPGTAAAVAVPPAVPTDFIPLFDVLMYPGATQSSEFQITRRTSRRIEFPGSSQHGILKDCTPRWGITDETTGSTPLLLLGSQVHRLVVDGELLTFGAPAGATNVIYATPDTINPPGTAPATNDLATYLYLCGGRTSPVCVGTSGPDTTPFNVSPVVLIESLTPPDPMGYPTDYLGFAGGTIDKRAAVFVGNAWRIANTTVHKCCRIDGDWVHALTHGSSVLAPSAGFNEADVVLSSSGQDVAVNTFPQNSTMGDFEAVVQATPYAGGADFSVIAEPDAPAYFSYDQQVARATEILSADTKGHAHLAWRGAITNSGLWFVQPYLTGMSTLALNLHGKAYNMNVPRIAR